MQRTIAALFLLALMLSTVAVANADETEVPTLSPPIVLHDFHVWRDGGSLGFAIEDQSLQRIEFVVDGRRRSPTAGWFFLDVTNPGNKEKGVKLLLGGTEEKQILRYLSLWLEANFDRNEIERIGATRKVSDLTREELKAWHIKRLIDHREETIKNIRKVLEGKAAPPAPAPDPSA